MFLKGNIPDWFKDLARNHFGHALPGYIDGSGLGEWRNQLTTLAVCTPVPMLTWIFLAPCSIMILVNLWGFFWGCGICQHCGILKSSSKALTRRQSQCHHIHRYTGCFFNWHPPEYVSWLAPPKFARTGSVPKFWNHYHFAGYLDAFWIWYLSANT